MDRKTAGGGGLQLERISGPMFLWSYGFSFLVLPSVYVRLVLILCSYILLPEHWLIFVMFEMLLCRQFRLEDCWLKMVGQVKWQVYAGVLKIRHTFIGANLPQSIIQHHTFEPPV